MPVTSTVCPVVSGAISPIPRRRSLTSSASVDFCSIQKHPPKYRNAPIVGSPVGTVKSNEDSQTPNVAVENNHKVTSTSLRSLGINTITPFSEGALSATDPIQSFKL